MSRISNPVRCILGLAPFALLSPLPVTTLRAQEIRSIAEPNQSTRMGRGGYVCEGHLTHTAIDAAEDWTYEMVQCTGPIYSSNDYAALQAKLGRDELLKLNDAVDQLNATIAANQEAINKQAVALNGDLRATIEKRFQDLPHDVLLTAAIQNLKKSLVEYIDQRLPRAHPTNPPESRPAPSGKSQQIPTSPQP